MRHSTWIVIIHHYVTQNMQLWTPEQKKIIFIDGISLVKQVLKGNYRFFKVKQEQTGGQGRLSKPVVSTMANTLAEKHSFVIELHNLRFNKLLIPSQQKKL
jgi:hypothetical protein